MPGSCSRVTEQGSHPGTGTLLGREVHRFTSVTKSFRLLLQEGVARFTSVTKSFRLLLQEGVAQRHQEEGGGAGREGQLGPSC